MAVDEDDYALTWDGRRWSVPVRVNPKVTSLSSVSCAGDSFCMAVDINGHAFAWDGRSWSAPAQVSPTVGVNVYGLSSVSCPSARFCVATTEVGPVSVWDGKKWSALMRPIRDSVTAVSCVSDDFCVLVGGADMATWDGRRWTAPVRVKTLPENSTGFRDGTLDAVSCARPSFCMASSGNGYFLDWDGTSWSRPVRLVLSAPLALSCASETFCMAVGPGRVSGHQLLTAVATWDGAHWSVADHFGTSEVSSLSCPVPSFCQAVVGASGDVFSWDGRGWSAPRVIDPPRGRPTAVSCGSATSCVVVDENGYAAYWDGSAWSKPARVVADGNSLVDVACAGKGFCAALEGDGGATTWDGKGWSRPQQVDPYGGLGLGGFLASCANGSFCAVVDGLGHVLTWDGRRWSAPVEVDKPPPCPQCVFGFIYSLSAVSCPAANFCMAVDDLGRAFTWDGTGWSTATTVVSNPDKRFPINPASELTGVSCTSATFCLAVTASGATFTWDGARWTSRGRAPLPAGGNFSVTCAAPTFCVGTNHQDSVVIWGGRQVVPAAVGWGIAGCRRAVLPNRRPLCSPPPRGRSADRAGPGRPAAWRTGVEYREALPA